MKIIRRLLLLSLLAINVTAHAQQQPSTPQLHRISARDAMDLALKQRIEILNAMLDIKDQEAFNKEVTGAAYPQIKGTMGLQRTFAIPVTVLPDFISPTVYGVLEKEGVQGANGNPIKWDGVVNTFPAQFGVPWQASVGVSVQQLLFQPDVFIGLKARSTAMELRENQLAVTQDSVKSNVLQAYYGVLIAERGLVFASESRDRLSKLYKDQEQLFKSGFIERLDLDKTKVNLNNINTQVTRLNNLIAVSYAGLKFALGLPQADSLVLTDSLSMDQLRKDVFSLEEDFKYESRPEVKTLLTSQELLELQVRRYKMNAYPTVAAFWNMQTNAQRKRFDFYDTGDRWFFSNLAGLSINVPIMDGWQRRNRVKQAEYALEKSRNTLNQFKQVVDLQVVSARSQFTNAMEALNAQIENKELAERVFETTKVKYQRGLGSSFELLQTETALQEALGNYYQALYNGVIAKINYMRALGKL
jgi:outer membrane protein